MSCASAFTIINLTDHHCNVSGTVLHPRHCWLHYYGLCLTVNDTSIATAIINAIAWYYCYPCYIVVATVTFTIITVHRCKYLHRCNTLCHCRLHCYCLCLTMTVTSIATTTVNVIMPSLLSPALSCHFCHHLHRHHHHSPIYRVWQRRCTTCHQRHHCYCLCLTVTGIFIINARKCNHSITIVAGIKLSLPPSPSPSSSHYHCKYWHWSRTLCHRNTFTIASV